ncbi:MAG TPA: DUF2155 domain-containing protein [Hyphomicrobiaceae bacterium]|nr:DUF2155 domain-containing protein [Hyphomicrobiaceae bacterium]
MNRPCTAVLRAAAWTAFLSAAVVVPSAQADRIANQIAVFAALDKVTARISTLQIRLNETKQFGSLKVTPRVCYTRSPTEPPRTSTFVEVDEVQLDGREDRIFTGWMFAESPGLNAVEHPVFDVWLTNCMQPPRPAIAKDGKVEPQPQDVDPADPFRRRVRR